MKPFRGRAFAGALAGACLISGAAGAATLFPYANVGEYNNVTYTFKAQATGHVVAYFTGASAAYESQIGLVVNGVAETTFGLDNHSSQIGQSIDFGQVNAGDTLVFVLKILSLGGKEIYSSPSLNSSFEGGASKANQIFATTYDGTDGKLAGVPGGTSVSFEDQAVGHSDYDYNDETFVFTNVGLTAKKGPPSGGPNDPDSPPGVTPVTGVPESAGWMTMILGSGFVGALSRRASARTRRRQGGLLAAGRGCRLRG
jgi:hypothetical protein